MTRKNAKVMQVAWRETAIDTHKYIVCSMGVLYVGVWVCGCVYRDGFRILLKWCDTCTEIKMEGFFFIYLHHSSRVCVCVFEREMHPPVSGKTTVSEQRGQLSFLAAVLISQEGRVKADNRFQISAWWIFPLCFHLFYLLFLHRQSTSKQ